MLILSRHNVENYPLEKVREEIDEQNNRSQALAQRIETCVDNETLVIYENMLASVKEAAKENILGQR